MVITLIVIILHIIGGTKIRIRTADDEGAAGDPVIFNLWADYKIYECTIHAKGRTEWYECDSSNTLTEIGTTCTQELKLLLTGTGGNAPVFDIINLITNTGNWYEINGFCHPNNEPLGPTSTDYYKQINNVCDHYGNYSNFHAFCIDTDGVEEGTSCFPAKQIIYFDINRPNQNIDDAEWRNGEHISTDTITCDPTPTPTNNPTPAPTDCVTNVQQVLATNSLTPWLESETTINVKDDANNCYATNPCIEIGGINAPGINDVYIEETLDTSGFNDITINIEAKTRSLDDVDEFGFIETVCNSETPVRTTFNEGINAHYSACLNVNTITCNTLTLRIGGGFSGTVDYVHVTQVLLDWTTSNPTTDPSFNPTTVPSFNPTIPSFNPTIVPSFNPTHFSSTAASSKPSISPITKSATPMKTTLSSEIDDFKENQDQKTELSKDDWKTTLSYIIYGAITFMAILCICSVFCFIQKRARKKDIKSKQTHSPQIIKTELVQTICSASYSPKSVESHVNGPNSLMGSKGNAQTEGIIDNGRGGHDLRSIETTNDFVQNGMHIDPANDDIVIGDDDNLVTDAGPLLYKECTQCLQIKNGRIDIDEQFYCNECWELFCYETAGNDQVTKGDDMDNKWENIAQDEFIVEESDPEQVTIRM